MKTYAQKLADCPIEVLESMIKKQEQEIIIMQRDLDTMKEVLEKRSPKESGS